LYDSLSLAIDDDSRALCSRCDDTAVLTRLADLQRRRVSVHLVRRKLFVLSRVQFNKYPIFLLRWYFYDVDCLLVSNPPDGKYSTV